MLDDVSIVYSGGLRIAEVHCVLPALTGPSERVAESLAGGVVRSVSGYAGFSTRGQLTSYLTDALVDRRQKKRLTLTITNTARAAIRLMTAGSLRRCYRYLPARVTQAFVFPTQSEFVRRRMGGCTGLTPREKTILLHVHIPGRANTWSRCLPSTVAHEYCHGVQLVHGRWNTVLDALVFEGAAEHFRDHVIGGPRSRWTRALTPARSRSLLLQLAPVFRSRDLELRRDLFFGGPRFRRWAGYSAGYFLVGAFLRKRPSMPWSRITQVDPRVVLRIAGVLDA